MSRNNNYTTGIYYIACIIEIIGADLSRQTNTGIPQYINFTGKLEDDDAAMFLSPKSSKIIF